MLTNFERAALANDTDELRILRAPPDRSQCNSINILLPTFDADVTCESGLIQLACFGAPNVADDSAESPRCEEPMNLRSLLPSHSEAWVVAPGPGSTSQPIAIGRFRGIEAAPYLFLSTAVAVTAEKNIRALSRELYAELLDLMDSLGYPRWIRAWNYVPEINQGAGDSETYRQFCWGRAEALGDRTLCAATGIGSRDGWLRISTLSTHPANHESALQLQHLENPRQLSAYLYPRQYGPKSPSFARATLLTGSAGAAHDDSPPRQGVLLLSGTASIVNHNSLHSGDLEAQTQETARNVQALLTKVAGSTKPLALRYYLRDETQLALARGAWHRCFPDWPEPAFYAADICRRELAMEVEGVFGVSASAAIAAV